MVDKYCYDVSTDDWTVDETLRFKNVISLESTNILKDTAVYEAGAVPVELPDGSVVYTEGKVFAGIDMEAVEAIKDELLSGHALSMCYHADTALAGDLERIPVYINLDNYAQFTYKSDSVNHAVTIVGYDDNYSRYNFLDHSEDADGDGEAHLPDGAWIVKNSWGAATEEFPNYRDWGTDGSGYFYLSYYDRSITGVESYNFDISLYKEKGTDYIVNQYDYMDANEYSSASSENELLSSNVFYAEEDQILSRIGVTCSTYDTDMQADIYLLNEGYTSPTDGVLVGSVSEFYKNAGFHTINVDPVFIKEGQYYSVVLEQKCTGDSGSENVISLAVGYSVQFASGILSWPVLKAKNTYTNFSTSVINPGESYVYSQGEWIDWSSEDADVVKNKVPGYEKEDMLLLGRALLDYVSGIITEEQFYAICNETDAELVEEYTEPVREMVVDNFPIKTYCEKAENTVSDISYKLDENGVLTITGEGDIENVYNEGITKLAPWSNYLSLVDKVIVAEGITNVMDEDGVLSDAFFNYTGWVMYENGDKEYRYVNGGLCEIKDNSKEEETTEEETTEEETTEEETTEEETTEEETTEEETTEEETTEEETTVEETTVEETTVEETTAEETSAKDNKEEDASLDTGDSGVNGLFIIAGLGVVLLSGAAMKKKKNN